MTEDVPPGPPSEFEGLSSDELRAIAEKLTEFNKDFESIAASVRPEVDKWIRDLAGSDLPNMLVSQKATIKYLMDPRARLRQAAISLTVRHWKIANLLGPVYERMIAIDADDDVRERALGALGTSYTGTKNRRIAGIFASHVCDEKMTKQIRLTAFASLLRLHGLLSYSGPSPLVPISLDQIDWEFVDGYRLDK